MQDGVALYRNQINELAERLLRSYIDRLKASAKWLTPRPKELNDAVWETVVLSPLEVVILDSPLLQRLRRIRQLGVVHWTYPCALHTRLEHSIGAVLQVQRLIDSMNRSDPAPDASENDKIPLSWINLVRLTALCHDVGHGLTSHVSEHALGQAPQIERLLLNLRKHLERKCSLSEAAAYFLLGSPAFADLLEQAKKVAGGPSSLLPNNPTQLMQSAVIGRVMSEKYPLLQELISGPYDADKLDYMTRDAHATGVPVVTDIPRLVQKVRLVSVGSADLPQKIANTVKPQSVHLVNAVALSGARTLDELMLGRTLLFDKVYRHQKVRAAEAMVAGIVSRLVPLLGDRAPILPLLLDDEDILDLNRGVLDEKLRIKITDEQWLELGPARQLSGRLRDRDLFVRAYAFSPYLPRDPFRTDPDRRKLYEGIAREMAKPEARRELVNEIIAQVERMHELLGGALAQGVTKDAIAALIALDPPPPAGETSPMARAYLVKSDGKLMPFRDDSPESSPWSNAYSLARDLGYVFAAPELADAVFLASELVFRTRYQVRTPDSAREYAKVHSARIDDLRQRLNSVNFYDGLPNDLKPEPNRLRMADVDQLISKIVENLGQFQGVYTQQQDKPEAVKIDAPRVRAFLKQFSTNEDVAAALRVLSAIRMLGRGDTIEAIDGFVARHPDFKNAFVCPLGALKDSGHHIAYYAHDLAGRHGFDVVSLTEALVGEQRPILFIDDFIGSGGQSENIVLNWFGREASLKENHGPPLSDHARKELQGRKVGFVFVAGDNAGLQRLQAASSKVDLSVIAEIHHPSDSLSKAFEGPAVKYEDEGHRDIFKSTATAIGKALLKTGTDKERSDEWVDEKAIGYGNHGYLVVFPYNVPTQTLTLLWQGGTVNGGAWLPLLPRRKKT